MSGVDLSLITTKLPTSPEETVKYLRDVMPLLGQALQQLQLPETLAFVAPVRLEDGDIGYADGTKWQPGDDNAKGLYQYRLDLAAWKRLAYLGDIPAVTGYQLKSEKDTANGYAGLTAGGLIKVAELTGLAPSFATIDLTTAVPSSPVAHRIYEDAGKWVEIERKAASSSSSLDFTTKIDSRFIAIRFRCVNLKPATNSVTLFLRYSTSATFRSDANYVYTDQITDSSAGNAAQGATTNTGLPISMTDTSNNTIFPFCGEVVVYDPSNTTNRKEAIYHTTSTGSLYRQLKGSGEYAGTTALSAVDGIRFIYSTGNIASGTIIAEGLLSV